MAPTPPPISGTVHNAEGRPVGLARVYFIDGTQPLPDIAALTNHDGTFFLSAPSPGTYKLEVTAEGFDPTAVSVTVDFGRRARLEIRLSA